MFQKFYFQRRIAVGSQHLNLQAESQWNYITRKTAPGCNIFKIICKDTKKYDKLKEQRMAKKQNRILLKDLNLTDRFLFDEVMEGP